MEKKFLLAISGGPDSMYLLDWYKNKSIVVAHVNYNKREDSTVDKEIVESFCIKNSIPFEYLDLHETPDNNFQSWARNKRYDFFKTIYDKYNCKKLLTAHHKDDFLETAIMQSESGRTPRYFGIREKTFLYGMNIERPFIDFVWKEQILKSLEKLGIDFATDYTNELPLFERNKVRLDLKQKSIHEKNSMYKWYKMSNKILDKKFAKVDALYKRWESKGFIWKDFKHLKYHEEISFKYLHDQIPNFKTSKGKIDNFISFLLSPEGGKEFKANIHFSVKKEKNTLSIIKNH